MGRNRINVTRSSMPAFEEYCEEIRPLWESRWLSNRGAVSKAFEEKLKGYLGVEELYLFANGHVALEVAIDGLDFPKGSEVITTPYTHVSTTHVITRNGLIPVFVDVKEDDYTINPDLIEDAITEKTVAIVATHVYGFMCDVERIKEIAEKHGLMVIYDAAHAFGVKYKGIGSGNYGDMAMFSTHATKVFHTIEGGIVTYKECDNDKFRTMRLKVNFGFTSPEDIDFVGTNARMNEFEAAMGICNLRHIDEEIKKRRIVVERYYERLDGVKGIKVLKPNSDTVWNYAYFPVIFDGFRYDRNQIQKMLEEKNVFSRKYFYPLTNKAACYKDLYGDARTPVAEHIAETVLTLPLYSDMNIDVVDYICDKILG